MISAKEIKDSFLHLLFPHICAGCGTDLLDKESMLCIRCIAGLPETNFSVHAGNPIEKMLWGRIPLASATATYYFSKESLIQHLVHQFKYKGNKDLGLQLGRLLGKYLVQSDRFNAEALVPLPLFAVKEKRRGYNQATILCEGIAEVMNVEILRDAIVRTQFTETQTRKGRIERWQNMERKFELMKPEKIEGKNILLVDDVITTGATLEACGRELLQASPNLSIATLCYASR